jgi:hypothetical protein
MGQYRIKSEPLGVDFMVEGDQAPNAKSTFQILKQVVSPDKMIEAYDGGNKQLTREAFKNGYFDQESDSGLYDVFKQAAGEVLEGLAGTTEGRPAWMDVAAPLIVMGQTPIWELPGKLFGKKKQATGYQALAEAFAGYKTIGDVGKLGFSKMVGEGDEDVDASIEFIKGMMETQSFIDDGAAIMAEYFGDIDMYNDLKSGRVEPNKKQAMAASLFIQPEGPLSATVTKGLSSTTNMLRRGTAKKLAEQLQNAETKKLFYSQQLNRLSAKAPDNVVQSATDALKNASKEADEILEKLRPYTEQKAKAGAGITNKAIGKTMQGLGKAGEYVGNMTEFLRRAGIEEATTFLMRTGLPETAAKGVVFATVGAGLDATDGEISFGGSGLNALAAYMGPRALASMGRSSAILGKQLSMAESSLPFFKRVGALPADNPKLSEVAVDRTENLVLGDATSQLKPILTQSRELPGLVQGVARGLDKSGIGRVLTEGANLTKATVAGASIPGAFGYMAGGEEGAASAIGASTPFIAAGLGYGTLLRFSNNSDFIGKQLGDLEYHKQSLTDAERKEFSKLKKDQQIAISTFSQFFPDAVIRVKSMGKDGPKGAQYVDGQDSIIEINSDHQDPLSVVLSHEVGHHIERHGLLPNILEELIGNAEKGKAGVFTKIDKKTGKPIIQKDKNGLKYYELNQEFRDLQKAYIDKLEQTNVSDKARQLYETPEQFAREIFAEIVAERMLTGKTQKRARQSTTYKLIESLGDRVTGGGFRRKVMHSLGMATKADGSIVRGTGVLGKAFKSSREIENIVKRYEDETIGLSESEIRKQRPVSSDEDLDTVIVSPNDPIDSLQMFNNGGHFKTNADGSIKINPLTKKPEVFTPAQTRQANQALARDLVDAIKAREDSLPEGHITLSETEDGKLVGSGKFIDDSIIDELARTGKYNASQISFLREASRAGKEGLGNQMLLFYYAATGKGGRKYKTLKGGFRDSLVYGITITKDGNVILDTVSIDKMQKNVEYLLKRRGGDIAQAFGGSDDATVRKNFESMFDKYLDNHAKGIINGDSNPKSGITDKQRDFLNAAFGPVSKSQIADNPTLGNLGERRANLLSSYRSRRLDRIGTLNPTGNTRNVVIDRLRRNLMPGRGDSDKLFMPADTNDPKILSLREQLEFLGGDEMMKGFKAQRYLNREETIDYLENLLTYRKENQNLTNKLGVDPEKKPLRANMRAREQGIDMTPYEQAVKNISSFQNTAIEKAKFRVQGGDNDILFMPASEAGAGKGKQAEAAKLWNEKGTDSPYFKKWFGKSKVVDENGEPLVVYHGTSDQFTAFDADRYQSINKGDFGEGFYFTPKKGQAKLYSQDAIKKTDPEVLALQKEYEAQAKQLGTSTMMAAIDLGLNSPEYKKLQQFENRLDQKLQSINKGNDEIIIDSYLSLENPLIVKSTSASDPFLAQSAKERGHDGIIVKFDNGRVDEIVAFSPEQIKSATGNRGTFDAGERNILFMPSLGDTTPASVQSWDGPNPTFGTNFTRGMAKDNKEAAALLRRSYEDEFGQPIKAQDFTDEQVNWLGDTLAKEGEAALGRTGNAVNWYTSAVEKALSVAEEIFPDIGQKFEAKDRFLGALSITSQNMRVMDNAKGAVKQYQHKERTGKFDYSIKHGAKADAITSNLKLYDKVEAKMGVDKLHDFLDADFTVKELIEWGKNFFGDKKFSIAGYSTDKVKGSAIFGPKIGQGFFQNLRGNYDPVTVDLWLRRTYGRLTGLSLDTALTAKDVGRLIYAVRNNKGKRKFADLEMPDFLKGISISGKVQKNGVANYKISDKAFETLLGDHTTGRNNYDAVYKFAEKLNREWERNFAKANNDVTKAKDAVKKAKKDKRGTANLEKQLAKFEAEKVAIGKEKPQWAKAGSTVSDKLKPIDIPSNAERAVITKAFNVALKALKDKGINLTPADLQATLWYPEKDIWAYLKGENSDALNMSYDTAMEVIRDQR